jgi:hypothetical protein
MPVEVAVGAFVGGSTSAALRRRPSDDRALDLCPLLDVAAQKL